MRTLFNHGLGIEDLFTNTPKRVVDREWGWYSKNFGSTNGYAEAISNPFKYALVLIFNKMLDERLRFITPQGAYFDFTSIMEDDFIRERQKGKFQDIDFINSDFTAYQVKFIFNGKSYKRYQNVYFGGELREKFIQNINNGIKYYTTEDFKINDIYHLIYEKFPEFTNKEIREIIKFGFGRMLSSIKYGCSCTLNTRRYGNCYVYIGKMLWEQRLQIENYKFRRDRKLRKIFQWKRPEFDGYYYVGITGTLFTDWLKENKYSKSKVKFKKVMVRKIMKELYYRYPEVYIFRIKVKKFKGLIFWKEKLDARETVYMGKVEKLKFSKAEITWKELIKQNEKRDT